MTDPVTSNTLLSRLHQALHIAMKHYRCDRNCGSSFVASDGSRGCGCGKVQDRFRIDKLFSDDEWKAIHAGRTPDEPEVVREAARYRQLVRNIVECKKRAGHVFGITVAEVDACIDDAIRIEAEAASSQPPESDLLREIRASHEQLRYQAADRGGVYQKCQCRYCATPTKEGE